jgi:retinol dehydrogenase-12
MWRVRDKTCLVTGATSGHGRAVARGLAERGAQVVILGRDAERCEQVRRELSQLGPEPRVVLCDLASLAETARTAAEYVASGQPLDLLVNNAGAVFRERQLSVDGYEMTFAVNYLSMFQLTLGLLPALEAAGAARIVNVASDVHRFCSLDPDDPDGQMRGGRHSLMGTYARSKLAIVYFTRELAHRLCDTSITVNCVDPGPVQSRIGQNNPGVARHVLTLVMRAFFPSAERAARTALHLCTAPELASVSGQYYRFMRERKPGLTGGPFSRNGHDISLGKRLWQTSEKICSNTKKYQ